MTCEYNFESENERALHYYTTHYNDVGGWKCKLFGHKYGKPSVMKVFRKGKLVERKCISCTRCNSYTEYILPENEKKVTKPNFSPTEEFFKTH